MDKLIIDGAEIKFSKNIGSRGWDASDEYLLSELKYIEGRTLIIDDIYGALACGIKGDVYIYNSSLINKTAVANSLKLNSRAATIVDSLNELPDGVKTVIIKLPKFIDQLEYYLQIVGKKLPGVKVLIGGMVKYMPISMVRLTESYFDSVTTSLAKKKARLIYATSAFNNTNPKTYPLSYKLDSGLEIYSYPGVFSSDHLDIGTRFLLDHIPTGIEGRIIDLGCASGVLGLSAKKLNPKADVILTDESYLAIESAKESFKRNSLEGSFYVMDTLKELQNNTADLILCNPPFHKGNTVLTDIAINMFKESKRVLKRGGVLFVVANRHLGYHKKLRSIYHNLTKVAENSKFFIFSVHKA